MLSRRESEIVHTFDHLLDGISSQVSLISQVAAREARDGRDIRAAGSGTERELERFEVMLDEMLIAALSANVTVRRELLETTEERNLTR